MKTLTILMVAVTCFCSANAAIANLQDCDSAMSAYDELNVRLHCDVVEIVEAAEQGDARSQIMLAELYLEGGFGVDRDSVAAFRWYTAAAEQGDTDALLGLSRLYGSGNGVTQDLGAEFRLIIAAAKQGNNRAQFKLGLFYHVRFDEYVLAYLWITIAAMNGNVEALERKIFIERYPIEHRLSQADLVAVPELARNCIASGYEVCEN